jgi:glyoxylase-like metal-dependent hydrolase (beta-lactamase superfamily II)
MTLKIISTTLGLVATNAYLIADTTTKRAVLIDPVDESDALLKLASDDGYTIALVLATHAHFDHVLASKTVVEATGAPFRIHAEAAPYLANLPETGLRFVGERYPEAATPTSHIADNEIIRLDGIRLQALYTPGHAPGHLSFHMPDHGIVFSGDALFAGAVGRTDLEGGSMQVLMNSIKTRLLTLSDDTNVLPGHGGATTIGHERQHNPYIQQFIG